MRKLNRRLAEGYPWPPGVVTEHAFAERGLP